MGKSIIEKGLDIGTGGLYGAATGKGAFEPPKSPDYEAEAERTAEANMKMLEEQTRANRPDQYNPWGSTTWQQDDEGRWSQNTTLNPESQAAFDAQQQMQLGKSQLGAGMMGRMKNEFGQQMDWGQYGDQKDLEFDPSQLRKRAEDASYNRATSRLDPRFEEGGQSLEIKLRNQGLSPGDEQYDAQMANFDRNKEDAYSNAQNIAVQQGRGESAQDFSQQKTSTDYTNQLRQNQIKEEMQKRGFSLNEMNAIMSGQQVNAPEFQQFNQAQRTPGTDYSGAAMNQNNFDQMQHQAGMGGLMDLANTGISAYGAGMFCDRRLKKHIREIGKYLGYPLYIFEYVWGEIAVGVMSDEINPEAVINHPSGFDWVNYDNIIPRGIPCQK